MKTALQTGCARGDNPPTARGPHSAPGHSAGGGPTTTTTHIDDDRTGRPLPSLALPTASPTEVILAEKYREETRAHVDRFPMLFRSLTGLRCHVIWSSIHPGQWPQRDLPSGSRLCRGLMKHNPKTSRRCDGCARHHLAAALSAVHAGHHFTCFLGVQNYWLPVIVRNNIVGLAYIQTLSSKPDSRWPETVSGRPADTVCRSAKRMNPMEFNRASRLLQLIFRHVELLTISELRKADLSRTQGALKELQTVTTHLRQDLNGLMPPLSKAIPDLQQLSRPERIAQDALDYIHTNYTHPITLQTCASALGLNAAYLSDLFSHRVGLPFKTYLTELRLEKAKELLANGALNISQVAVAVGYVSTNRFRAAFKTATGCTPKAWSETWRMQR